MNEPRSRTYSPATALVAIRSRAIPILLAGALIALGALAFTLSRDEVYKAEAFVLPRDPGFANQAFDPRVSVAPVAPANLAETDLAALDQVAERTSQALGGALTSVQVSDQVDVTDTGTGLISIEAEASSATAASDLANAYANAAIESRRDAQVAVVEQAQKAARAELQGLPAGSAERGRLERKLADLRDFQAFQTGNLEQVQAADTPPAPESRALVSGVLGGGIAGILLGIAGALLADRVRPRIGDRATAEEALGAPVIATFGADGGSGRTGADPIEVARGRILHRTGQAPPRSLLIVPLAGEPAGAVARRLAAAFAGSGRRTVLVDADLRGSGAGAPRGPGLAELIEGSVEPREVIASDAENGDSIPPGEVRADPGGLLDREAAGALLDDLSRDYALTVICAPSPIEHPDAIPLIARADATLAVIAGGSAEGRARRLRGEIDAVGGRFAGVILLDR